jgi:serine/threonine-protein kinase
VVTALGLVPDNRSARLTVVRLFTETYATMTAELEAQMAAGALAAFRLAARGALLFYAGYLLYLPLLLWMGVRDWRLFALGWATIVACALTTYASLRRARARLARPLWHLALSTFTVATVSVLFGPYVLVPMLALGLCVSYTASIGHMRGLVPVASCLAVIVPAALQWLGVLPPSYRFEADGWIVLPTVFHISARPTQAFLLAAIVGTVVPACIFVARLRRAYLDAERKLQLQAWQLRQIVPRDD